MSSDQSNRGSKQKIREETRRVREALGDSLLHFKKPRETAGGAADESSFQAPSQTAKKTVSSVGNKRVTKTDKR